MLDFEKVLNLLSGLVLLRFFPSEASARVDLAKLVAEMAGTYEQIDWLVTRTLQLCNDWPGPVVLRQIFCSKFKPRDGIEAGSTAMFPEGIPSERPASAMRALPPGHVATSNAGLDKAIQATGEAHDLNLAVYTPLPNYAELEELRRARLRAQHRKIMQEMGLKPLTQEDIDRAVREARKKKGGEA